jgi:hypothetical protein
MALKKTTNQNVFSLFALLLFLALAGMTACSEGSGNNTEELGSNRSGDPLHGPTHELRSYNDVPGIWRRLHAQVLKEKGITGEGIRVGIIDDGIRCQEPELAGKCVYGLKTFIQGGIRTLDRVSQNKQWAKPVDPYFHIRESEGIYTDGAHGTGMAMIIAGNENSNGQVGFASGAQVIPYGGTEEFPVTFKIAYEKHQVRIVSNSFGSPATFPDLVDEWVPRMHRASHIRYDHQLFDRFLNPGFPVYNYLTESENKQPTEIQAIVDEMKQKHRKLVDDPTYRHRTPELIRVFCAKNQGQTHAQTPGITPFSVDVPASGYPDDGNILIVGAVDEENRLTSSSLRPGNTRKFFVVVPTGGATSPAAPTVAGILAALMEADTKLFNHHGRPARQYVDAILETATPLADADASGTGPDTGRGLVNVEGALNWLKNHP